jgi:hypothetical protein
VAVGWAKSPAVVLQFDKYRRAILPARSNERVARVGIRAA